MSKTKIYEITVHGYDASTTVYRKINNPEELALITELIQQINGASNGGCTPTVSIEETADDGNMLFDIYQVIFEHEPNIYEFLRGEKHESLLRYDFYKDAIQSALNNKYTLESVFGVEIVPANKLSSDYILRKKENV